MNREILIVDLDLAQMFRAVQKVVFGDVKGHAVY